MPATAISLPVTATSSEGPETAPPLVIAHGLFGQARNFASLSKRFAAGRRVLTVDMRNHGEAPHAEPMDYPAMAADLASVIAGEAGGRAVLLGHSMGGKAAMTLALSYPDCLAALIVADIAPVAYEHYEHGSILGALRAADLSGVTRRSEADPILAPDIPDPGIRAFILQNLAVDREGARWRPGLAEIEAGMPAILGFPEDFLEPAFEGPTLFLHGAASHYVLPEHHPRIRALFPDAEIEALPGAGHWLHAEKPDAFHAAVTRFLETL